MGSTVSTTPPEQDRAEAESEGTEGDEHGDLGRAQALRRIGAIAHDRARKHRGADIVRKRIGGERGDGDEKPGNVADAEMQKRDPVIPGQRQIGHERRQSREGIAPPRDSRQALPNVIERQAAELTIQKPTGDDDCDKPDDGPDKLTHIFHRRRRSPSAGDPCVPEIRCSARGIRAANSTRRTSRDMAWHLAAEP